MIKGMDLSSLLEVERCGGKFYDQGKNKDAVDILKSYGMNLARLRLWNDPFAENGASYGGGGGDIETVLTLAKRAQEKGIGWFLDFHYSDCWADPGKQTVPKAWKGMNARELERAVYDYTAEILERCARERILPQIVSVGNEVSNGLLWPVGKTPAYENVARFISSGIRAVRACAPEAEVMIHLDNGGNNGLYREWFDSYLENGGEDFDYIGLSYYPFWHGTLSMLENNMRDIALQYRKKLIVAEISTAYTLKDYKDYEKLPDSRRKGMAARPELAKRASLDITPEGQAQFMRDALQLIRRVPDGLGAGFCYWEPAWLPVPGSVWATEEAVAYMHEKGPGGNEWANQALFDYDGNALAALQVIRDA